MLELGMIQESKSNWSSPVHIVEKLKKESLGELRFCVDYRKLNSRTKCDLYPLPRIQDILNKFKGTSYFTTLDLASGFHQVEMKPENVEFTVFTTEFGIYEFLVISFGLMNAPLTFQQLVDKIFISSEKNFILVYIDDIIIFSRTWTEHLDHIQQTFTRLQESNLKIKLKKCYFACCSVEYLGFVIAGNGIRTNLAK